MTFFMNIANVINLIIEHWIISVPVLAVFASLCLGIFKGVKHGIRAMIVVLVVEILAVCAFVVYTIIQKDNELEKLIKFGIAWLPTIIFVIIVTLSTLIGVRRGLRKSLILMLHSVIIAGVCIGLYFFCVTSPVVDKGLLDFVNIFMGDGGLQSQLGVSSECETIREVLLELVDYYIVDFNLGEFGILLQANSAYILTIINMAYRLAFALVCYFIYLLLSFIMYIIYLIFYPERRYKKNRNSRFAMNKTDCAYNKRPVGGGCVGLVRGLISGIISLSFVGSLFFVAAGGIGASKLPEDVSFGEDYDPLISVYRSIEDYGEQGIFKVLNSISDPEDTPYYLFAADLVFSGGLDDELHGVSGNINFRKELAAYTGFAKNTLALLMKYDNDGKVASVLRGEVSEGKMDIVLNVCSKPEFRVEFDNLIDNFDMQTYIINFAFSLADAVVANIDNMSFMDSVSADNKELLQVMFSRGYLCDTIPDERERKYKASGEASEEIPPYLTINHLFTKKDAQIVLDIVLSVLANEIDVSDPATVARVLIPNIEKLSILSTERSKEMDPVLGRLYCYFDNKYLTDEGEDGIRYSEVKNESVFWTKEIRALFSVSDGLYTIYKKVYGKDKENVFTEVVSLFDDTKDDYAENVRMYEELTDVVSDSVLLSKVLCSKKISNLLNEQFKKINENFYLPAKITYENKYDENGELISHGEAYQIFRGLRLLADKDNKEIIDSLLNQSSEPADDTSDDSAESESSFEDLITKLAETLTKPDPYAAGNSLASYFTESVLLRSAISSVIMERAGEMLVVPTLSLETDEENQTVNLINKYELREIFEALPELIDLILPLASEEITATHINNILENDRFNSLLDNGNKIVEGTIANALISVFGGNQNQKIIIPKKLENYEEWITVEGTAGELRKFVNTIKVLELDIESMMNGGGLERGEIFEKLKTLNSDEIEKLLSSGVFHYTSSDMMLKDGFGLDGFTVIVPLSSCTELIDDNVDKVIKKDELASLFIELKDFGLTDGMTNESIIKKLVEKKDVLDRSNIISASVVNYIVENEDISSSLNIPDAYKEAGLRDKLSSYDSSNLWRKELPRMIEAVDEIFGISNMGYDEDFVFNNTTISEKTNDLLKSLNDPSILKPDLKLTRLDVCYASDILKNNITAELDKALNGVVNDDVIASAKVNGYYSAAELRALSETANLFDLDILKIDNNELTDKVKKEILTINKPRPDDNKNRSTLEIMYPSAIIRYFVTDEIDKALSGSNKEDESLIDIEVRDSFKRGELTNKVYPMNEISALVDALAALGINNIDDVNSTDSFTALSKYRNNIDVICESGIVTGIITKQIDKALTEDVIDSAVKAQIKGSNKAYSAKEISALITALDELNLTDFNDINDFDFSKELNNLKEDSKKESGNTKLNVIYKSNVVVGVITKTVKDTFDDSEDLVYHPLANRNDLAVLKEQEIDALVSLLGTVDLDNFDVGEISLSSVIEQLTPDSNGNPRSYLISANFSSSLIKNTSLYVPSKVYSGGLINAYEAVRFTDALIALRGDNSFNDWTVEDNMVLPDRVNRERVLKSEIMRATFSHYIFTKNENNEEIKFSHSSVDLTSTRIAKYGETQTKMAVISLEQLEALFDVIESFGGEKLEIPKFETLEEIKGYSDFIDLLYKFEVTRYNISEIILTKLAYVRNELEKYVYTDECYHFKALGEIISWQSSNVEALTYDGIVNIINGNMPN